MPTFSRAKNTENGTGDGRYRDRLRSCQDLLDGERLFDQFLTAGNLLGEVFV